MRRVIDHQKRPFPLASFVPPLPQPDHIDAFRGPLLEWFAGVARTLPWRETDDPYRIWLSEVMLQQTRVDQATPYYFRFLDAFPTLEALASAPIDAVLKRWEGLGYYARARNFHKAAQQVVALHEGTVPSTYASFRALPGVGPYTAAAVLSLAFSQPYAVLDGNVARVLARVFAIDTDVKAGATRKGLQALADTLLHPAHPGPFNEAMMELGATVCTPRNPDCPQCPLAAICSAHATGQQAAYPYSKPKPSTPHYDIAVGILLDEQQRILIQRRPEDGLLGGLWEFPGGKREPSESIEAACRRELLEELGVDVFLEQPLVPVKHAYTHFKITLHAFLGRIIAGEPSARLGQPLRWVALEALDEYAFPRANLHLIEQLRHARYAPTFFD